VIGTLSLAGVPLFAGFASKEEVLGAVWSGGFAMPFVLLLFSAFLTAFYMFRVVFVAFFADGGGRREAGGAEIPDPGSSHLASRASHPAHPASHIAHPHDPPAIMTGPLWVLAAIAVAIGLYFTVNPPHGEHAPPGWLTPAAIGVALSGILLAWLTYQRRIVSADTLASTFAPIRYAALKKFWLDDIFLAIYRSVMLTLARAVGWLDRYLVDGVLNVVSAWTLDGGDLLRRIQTGKVQDYVWAVGFGLLALMAWIGVSW
jgi:NADH-quinone oxidoreductase subunit L